MENYIDFINAYLNKTLSEPEVLAFKNRLQTDTEFKSIYDEHLIVLRGIERTLIKEEIKEARNSFVRGKWLKLIGGLIGVLILTFLVCFLFFNNKTAKNELREALNFETEFVQYFKVSSDSIITIEGKKGTRLTINPQDLEFQSKNPLKNESLTIQLIELINKRELLLANTQTISNGEWLISGGAFKIDIKANNENLVLKEGKTIKAKFPKNTSEEAMQIFYGERDDKGYLDWNLSDIKLKNERYFTIFCEDKIVLDSLRTMAFGGVETMKHILKIDTLNYLTEKEIKLMFTELNGFNEQRDTLIVYKKIPFEEVEKDDTTDELFDSENHFSVISLNDYQLLINRKYNDSILTSYNSSKLIKRNEKLKAFYGAIDISKLGWINIDQYSNIEDKITITFENNLDVNFNTFKDEAYSDNSKWHEIYLIDDENNTILNVYSSSLEIPIGKPFTIISCCIVDDTFYVSRQAINFNEDGTVILNYKKRNKSQIKALVRL